MSNSAANVAAAAVLPARIGPYRIIGLLGEGTTGRVFLAEEADPPRQIALKVLRATTLPAEARSRFRREAELLARLEHPAIARLYAAGVAETDAGPLPYLAMERVQGHDLMCHARERSLDLQAKLALLAEIGRAVHYAHSRGIVHRDLKPANILVDADGRPHILDFGLAHMVRDDATAVTLNGQVFGTVPYMSAEQLAGSRSADDPRSDVYALGVIAYELLSGRLPYPGLSTSTVLEAIALIREGRVEPLSRLAPQTRGDVETVVMKAMAQEASHRYGSAAELAADLERWLQHRPIEARPPTARYLLGLFVRRHRALSAAIALAVLALIAGSTVALRFGLAEAAARRQADATNAFLEKMLTAADPEQDLGRDLRVRDVLDAARRELPDVHDDAVAVSLYRTLGATYLSLAQTDAALDLLDRATALAGDRDILATRQVRLMHGKALAQKGRQADAEREFAALAALPARDDEEWRLRFAARRELAIAMLEQSRHPEGEAQLLSLAGDIAARFGAEDQQALVAAADHAAVMQINGKAQEALEEQRRLLAIQTRLLGPDASETLDVQGSLAVTLVDFEKVDEALPLMRDVLARERRVYGDDHPKTLISLQNLATFTAHADLQDESLALRRELLERSRERYGLAHARTIAALAMMATIEDRMDRAADAEAHYREAVAAAHSDPALAAEGIVPQHNLATFLLRHDRAREARPQFESAVAQARAQYGADNWQTAAFTANYGNCLLKLGEPAAARVQLENALAVLEKELGSEHSRSKDTRGFLRAAYRALGLNAQADALPP